MRAVTRQTRDRTMALCLALIVGAGGLVSFVGCGAPEATSRPGPAGAAVPLDLAGSAPTTEELRASTAGANIVICVLDAARRDHLGCYGYPRGTTPNIDRLARESLVFERHYCQHTQTKASTASLFTGQHPPTHGTYRQVPLDRSAFTMASGLQAAGYDTAFFSSNVWLASDKGLASGFAHVCAASRGPAGRGVSGGREARVDRLPESLLAQLREWLESRPGPPFFAYLHFLPPHSPYGDPAEAAQLFEGDEAPSFRPGRMPFRGIGEKGGPPEHDSPGPELIDLYDANLRKADWAAQQVLDLLSEADVFDNTLFVLTADHGETFGEHGYRWHAACPYDETVRIPLVIRLPGGAGPRGRVGALTQAVDLLPTLFDLLDLPYPEQSVQGRSLLPLLTGQVDEINEYVYSQTEGELPCYAVHDLRYSLLLYQGGKLRALYDTESDPWQTRSVIDERPEEAARLAEAFRRFAAAQRYPPLDYLDPDAPRTGIPARPQRQLSQEEQEELKALGYLR